MAPTEGLVATPHHLATRAGERALAQGGSAVDAAVAAAAVLTVVYPHMCALGGDAQALLALPGGAVRALSGSGAAARAADASLLRAHHTTMPIHGVHAITVPGLVAAWGDLHAAGGCLPWQALFTDALALAEEGTQVAAALGRDLAALHERLGTDAGLRDVFFHPDGTGINHWNTARLYFKGPDSYLNWDLLTNMAAYRGHMVNTVFGTSNGGATTHAFGFKVDGYSSFGKDGDGGVTPATDQFINSLSGYQGSIMRQSGNAVCP